MCFPHSVGSTLSPFFEPNIYQNEVLQSFLYSLYLTNGIKHFPSIPSSSRVRVSSTATCSQTLPAVNQHSLQTSGARDKMGRYIQDEDSRVREKKKSHLAGLEPATFRLIAERANRLRQPIAPQVLAWGGLQKT